MPPPLFRSARALRRLNVAAVGLALAAVLSTGLGYLVGQLEISVAFVAGLPTLILGAWWAHLVRWPATIKKLKIRWGWLLAAPLAMLDAGLIAGFSLHQGGSLADFGNWFLFGIIYGCVVWVPILLILFFFFGFPLVAFENLAPRGLVSEERGERLIGLFMAFFCLLALLFAAYHNLLHSPPAPPYINYLFDIEDSRRFPVQRMQLAGLVMMATTGILGLVAGGSSAALVTWRARQRRHFVARAESGTLSGYRVEIAPQGRVLMRVAEPDENYRATDRDEELFDLDEWDPTEDPGEPEAAAKGLEQGPEG